MTEDNGSLWTACWEPFAPAAAVSLSLSLPPPSPRPVLRLLRQTFGKVARGLSPQIMATVANRVRKRVCMRLCPCFRESLRNLFSMGDSGLPVCLASVFLPLAFGNCQEMYCTFYLHSVGQTRQDPGR